MHTLFYFFLFIDLLAAVYLFREGFVVRSNMSKKYKRRFVLLLGVVVAAFSMAGRHIGLACRLAGLPAGIALVFGILIWLAIFLHKGPWR